MSVLPFLWYCSWKQQKSGDHSLCWRLSEEVSRSPSARGRRRRGRRLFSLVVLLCRSRCRRVAMTGRNGKNVRKILNKSLKPLRSPLWAYLSSLCVISLLQVSIWTSRPLFMEHISMYSCRWRFMSLLAVASSSCYQSTQSSNPQNNIMSNTFWWFAMEVCLLKLLC